MLVELNPVMFELGPFSIRWYGFFMAVSVAVGLYFMVKNGRTKRINEDYLYNAALMAIIGGVIGARLIYVITNWGDYAQNLIEVIRVDHGGLSFHGALLGGVLPVWWYLNKKGIRFGAVADLAVPGLAIGYSLVRIGNIFNQEVLGRTAGFLGFERHPAQLYGAAIGVALLVIYNLQARKSRPDGYLFWSFVLYYQLLRAIVEETFRDNPLYLQVYVNPELGVGLFTLTQLITVPLAVFAWWELWLAKRSVKPTESLSVCDS